MRGCVFVFSAVSSEQLFPGCCSEALSFSHTRKEGSEGMGWFPWWQKEECNTETKFMHHPCPPLERHPDSRVCVRDKGVHEKIQMVCFCLFLWNETTPVVTIVTFAYILSAPMLVCVCAASTVTCERIFDRKRKTAGTMWGENNEQRG